MAFQDLTAFLDTLPGLDTPGVDCIVMRDHREIYRHYAGCSDREAGLPMNGQERFILYSVTKPITCAAALQLYEKGAFLLTDPLCEYIPEYKDMQVAFTDENGQPQLRKAERPILVRDLFTMGSGLAGERRTEAVKAVIKNTNGAAPTLQVVKAMAQQPLLFEPGSGYCYGISHDVLGGLIEVISGKKLGDYFKESIFQPLGMSRTEHLHGDGAKKGVMAQYRRDRVTNQVLRIPCTHPSDLGTEYESGATGVVSCTEDYAKFNDALACGGIGATGERILSPATIKLMRTNQLCPAQLADFNRTIGWHGYGYGLGVRTHMDPVVSGSNSSLGEFGWSGWAGAFTLVDPAERLSLFFASHVVDNIDGYIHLRLRNILYGSL